MTNKEFYKEKIFDIACNFGNIAVVNSEPADCSLMHGCEICDFYGKGKCAELLKDWLEQEHLEHEHEEPKIQPEVKRCKVDDRILVSKDGKAWIKVHFNRYAEEEDLVYSYRYGNTSWSSTGTMAWQYAKLPEIVSKIKKSNIDEAIKKIGSLHNTRVIVSHDGNILERRYAVYNDNALVGGVYDNDMMDWFNSYEGAEKQAQELANETGLTSYLSEVIDGDFADEFEEIEPEE